MTIMSGIGTAIMNAVGTTIVNDVGMTIMNGIVNTVLWIATVLQVCPHLVVVLEGNP